MKNLLVCFFCLFVLSSFAQCTSCTISISGTDAADHVVTIGQVLCVQPTGILTGRVYVTSGGILCNQGHINSHNIAISGGGEFDNYGVANVDTFFVYGSSAVFHNEDSMTNNLAGASSGPSITNAGVWSCFSFWDTAVNFTNTGSFATAQNIYLGTNCTFTNHHVFVVGHNFYNGPGSTFSTDCMVRIDSNWYNSGTINGPASGCGGFDITGQSYNTGTVGSTGNIDLCDAGHPVSGIDGNSGTMTGVTFCQCQNSCITTVGMGQIPDPATSFSVYPNPAADRLQIKFAEETEGTISMQNTLGATMQKWSLPMGTTEISLNTSALSNGLYILTVETKRGSASHKIEIAR